MPEISLITLRNFPIYSQLQLEEALLRTDHRNWCLINIGSSPAIVMGISGKPEKLIHLKKMEIHPIPLVKRFSGGGTVVVDYNTIFITLICNEACTSVPCSPDQVMRWNGQLYHDFLSPHGFKMEENDYTISNKKFGGNAQYLTKKRWLQHSTLLWDYFSEHMDYLLIPDKSPNYRNQRPHDEFLCRLKEYFPKPEIFVSSFMESLQKIFAVEEVQLEHLNGILTRPHRKSTLLM